jgi:hypothetical protein
MNSEEAVATHYAALARELLQEWWVAEKAATERQSGSEPAK